MKENKRWNVDLDHAWGNLETRARKQYKKKKQNFSREKNSSVSQINLLQ